MVVARGVDVDAVESVLVAGHAPGEARADQSRKPAPLDPFAAQELPIVQLLSDFRSTSSKVAPITGMNDTCFACSRAIRHAHAIPLVRPIRDRFGHYLATGRSRPDSAGVRP